MKNEIIKNKENIKEVLINLEKNNKNNIEVTLQLYRINLILNYKELKEKYISLIYNDVK